MDETLITVGATWSTVTGKISEAFPVLPAASVALAVIAWFPVASVVAIVNVPKFQRRFQRRHVLRYRRRRLPRP
ncbi:MAG: hypothetical protein EB058_14615 [Proteobacteria bacterium]|nr:hypothetical protein [Pseudomonadota bacterium]